MAKHADVSSIKNIMCGAAPIGTELTELTCKKFNIQYIIEGVVFHILILEVQTVTLFLSCRIWYDRAESYEPYGTCRRYQ